MDSTKQSFSEVELKPCPFCGKPVCGATNITYMNGKFHLSHTCFTGYYGWGAVAVSKIEFWANAKSELVRFWNERN